MIANSFIGIGSAHGIVLGKCLHTGGQASSPEVERLVDEQNREHDPIAPPTPLWKNVAGKLACPLVDE
ncbi:hypothetical protein T10_10643 [Trichinella papuae]|uniref:Uncharacterized protein n=1 Tax=Trichinella papuae TaxID=268474 RepID=A0A0V1N748_9BILA|nr:hypothetical protein T10_10643 [Trichinella papuae]